MRLIVQPFKTLFFMLKWRRSNQHNSTFAMNAFHAENVKVGKETYGPVEVLYDSGTGRLTIGNYCSIAKEVKFLLGGGIIIRKSALSLF